MYFKLIIFYLLLSFDGNTQTNRIDSLKKALPSQNNKAQVNCLNALSWQFYYHWIHSDSALKYAKLAYNKASAIQYNIGKGESLIIQAGVNGRLLGHPGTMDKLSREAIALLINENDPKNLSTAYYSLALALAIKGVYNEAHEAASNAERIAKAANDKLGLAWAKEVKGFIYSKSGDYWNAFGNLIVSQEMGKELNDSLLVSMSLAFIGRAFNRAGDPQKALSYYHQSLQYATAFELLWPHLEDMAYACLQLQQYDSAQYFQHKHQRNVDSLTTDQLVRKKFSGYFWGLTIEIELAKKEYDKILVLLLPLLKEQRKTRDVIPLMQSLLTLSKVYEAKGNYHKALQLGREFMQIARHTNNKQSLLEGNQLMASVFEHLRQGDSAYYYFTHYSAIKDSMETVQYAGRTALYLAASEAENRIRLIKKDNEINEQQLVLNKKELLKQSQLKNIMVISLIILLLISFLFFRNINLKRKNEKLRYEQEQSALKQKTLELEMQALRGQMNPHFIFNCLSAIDNLVHTRQSDKATAYLSRFAKLIRGVLDSSKNNLVPFQKDFETLRLYLEMEQFRCNGKFNFDLNAEQELLEGDYKVPPLIIQPFIENAIHHGLLNKQDSNRQLQVYAELREDHIIYSVTDNGVGRKRAAVLKEINKPEQQSYGIDITTQRIHLHNKNDISKDVVITDLELEDVPSGTQAVIRISNCES